MLRTSALRRGLAAAAVLAVGAGCTVGPGGDRPAGADGKPGGGAGALVTPGPGSSSVSAPPRPSKNPAARPGGARTSPAASPAASASASASASAREPSTRTPSARTPSARTASPGAARPRTVLASGATSDQVRELQARLRQAGHFDRTPTGYYGTLTAAAVSSFQGGRGLSRTGTTDVVTWRKLLGTTRKPTRDELWPPTERPVAAPDPRCLKGRVLCVSKNSRTLSWMVDGRRVSTMDVRFGSQYTPTREGTFTVYWKSRHHVSTLYDTAMPYAMFFSGGQAVHFSADFAARGYSGASHGCVNVRDEAKIASLFAQVQTGDKVVIYW
ncbi:L,D-transpeptidase family protein [Streptomyces liangshanensis]|uniref:Murein L,D-transpeptidase n=1 Tax=Streptomyces liangshanensis TaxID=2717324 RepID=A0A6G9GXU1_9ACTN|nr:L,D-transpeptidase family protein [Streptomyces liangshanensis]QIQ03030.1 murein L,D-transpeptidase [Streptomyces liangshanensis]